MTQFPQVFTSELIPELYGFTYRGATAKIVWHIECTFENNGISRIKIVPESIEIEVTQYQENEEGDRIEDKVTAQSIDLMAFEVECLCKWGARSIKILHASIDFEELKISLEW